MLDIQKELLIAMDERIKLHLSELQFDKTYYGKIVSIDHAQATVSINGANYNCRIKHGITLEINDVVIVKAPNGNFNFLYVDGRLV